MFTGAGRISRSQNTRRRPDPQGRCRPRCRWDGRANSVWARKPCRFDQSTAAVLLARGEGAASRCTRWANVVRCGGSRWQLARPAALSASACKPETVRGSQVGEAPEARSCRARAHLSGRSQRRRAPRWSTEPIILAIEAQCAQFRLTAAASLRMLELSSGSLRKTTRGRRALVERLTQRCDTMRAVGGQAAPLCSTAVGPGAVPIKGRLRVQRVCDRDQRSPCLLSVPHRPRPRPLPATPGRRSARGISSSSAGVSQQLCQFARSSAAQHFCPHRAGRSIADPAELKLLSSHRPIPLPSPGLAQAPACH